MGAKLATLSGWEWVAYVFDSTVNNNNQFWACVSSYVEKSRCSFHLSVLCFPVIQHEQQFERIWLAGFTCLLHEKACVSFQPSLVGREELASGWEFSNDQIVEKISGNKDCHHFHSLSPVNQPIKVGLHHA